MIFFKINIQDKYLELVWNIKNNQGKNLFCFFLIQCFGYIFK
jgi:hypothetical protein